MTTSFASAVPRFKEEGNGPNCKVDTYNARDPSNPPLGVIDPARKSVVFASTAPQRANMTQERTAVFVAPGAYDPKYSLIFPDLIRLHQFDGKRSAMFASTSQRFRSKKVTQTPDVRWSLEKDAAYWQSNRDGGGCWGKAHARESGSIAIMEKKLREAAAAQGSIGADDPDSILNQERRFHQVVSFVPLDLCFREMQDVQDMLREEPLPLYNGKLPKRVAPPRAESAGPAAAEADAERMPRRGSASQIEEVEPSPDEIVALPHRFVCNTCAPHRSNRPTPPATRLPLTCFGRARQAAAQQQPAPLGSAAAQGAWCAARRRLPPRAARPLLQQAHPHRARPRHPRQPRDDPPAHQHARAHRGPRAPQAAAQAQAPHPHVQPSRGQDRRLPLPRRGQPAQPQVAR